MADDITTLILEDHEQFRRDFAALDELSAVEDLRRAWAPLADFLEVHAAAEEEVFYPELIKRGENAEDETLDAIGDHNEIRDGVREAALQPVGSKAWYAAVRKARVANSEHMAEEEDDALSDFRRHADPGLRAELGRRFLAFKQEHAGKHDVGTSDIDPQTYVESIEAAAGLDATQDQSLRIGSLKGRD